MRRWILVVASCLALDASAAQAQSAADVSAARELFIEGAAASRAGEWRNARDAYARSLALKRSMATLYSLAITQVKTGELVEAMESFRAFLVETKQSDPYRETASAQLLALESRVATLDLVLLRPTAGVEVRVDGVLVHSAALGRARTVNPGRHEVTGAAEGYQPFTTSVQVAEGKRVRVPIVLERAKPASGGGARRNFAPGGAVVGVGLGIFAIGLGVGLSGVFAAQGAPTKHGPEADDARSRLTVGDVIGGTGAALVLVGIVVLAVEGAKKVPSPAKTQALRGVFVF